MLDSREPAGTASSGAMAKKGRPATKPERAEVIPGQADRLQRLRKAYGFETSTAFAAFLGIGLQRWNAFENGSPLSREVVFLLVRKFAGLTSDWLYFARTDGLPLELARRLGEFVPPGKRTT